MTKDHELQQAVQAGLAWEPRVTAAHIGISAEGGVVTLNGHVETYPEKWAAEEAAAGVRGVRAVANEIEVRLPFERQRDDKDIAAAALDRLAWSAGIPAERFQVMVEKGWVTLTGVADRHFQREEAELDVRRLHGVVGVSNQITIKPVVDTGTLSDDIIHALHRSWFFDTNPVHVSAEGGRVHLTGTVGSPHERQSAASTAWSAAGVTSVVNDITVS